MKGFFGLVAVWVFPLVNLVAGDGASSGQFGAHWARVSDRAQIQLIVDELRSATERGRDGIVRKHVAPGFVQTPAPSRASAFFVSVTSKDNIHLEGAVANVEFANGSAMQLRKTPQGWRVTGGTLPAPVSALAEAPLRSASGVSVGSTFIETPLSRDHDIDRLSRSVTHSKLNRALFGSADKTASYYFARYTNRAPFVTATYVQLVTDPEWNRIVYGNMNHWIKAYDNVAGPSAIAVDAEGRVFVGETGKQQISVLKLVGEGAETQLQHFFTIQNINPTDIAWSDGGTPLDVSDDHLYVADAPANVVVKFSLGANGAVRETEFGGFDSPTAILAGKWNGAGNGVLYVVDKIGKRVRSFEDRGNELLQVNEMRGNNRQYFRSMKSDHFGHVYLVDNVHSQVLKYTADLQLLDVQGGDETFAALGTVDIPFGKIVVEGEGTYWAGFDQLFAVERWSDETGAQRRILGLRLNSIDFSADKDISQISNAFLMTDFANVTVRVLDSRKNPVRTVNSSWMVSGQKNIVWDRRDNSGLLVPAGVYQYEIAATSAYRQDVIRSTTELSLPMYYWEDGGSSNSNDNLHMVQGNAVRWGTAPTQTADEHSEAVRYRFSGLDPESEYEVAAEYIAHDGTSRLQNMSADGSVLHPTVSVAGEAHHTGFIRLPKESYAEGEVTVSINRLGEGTAIISQLWMKQVGVGFGFQPVNSGVPTAYALEQNYPNPFNPTTMIRYAIPDDGMVTLKVYTIAGQEVTTLVNEQKPPGIYEVGFDAVNASGRRLASGVYFYRLTAGKFSDVRKFLLLK
ncbi:MAG: FlgD immunoglobulin-like domain containing protein [Bacteroidota bacterium]